MGIVIKGMGIPDYEYCTCRLFKRDDKFYFAVTTDFEIGENYEIVTHWEEYPIEPIEPGRQLVDKDDLLEKCYIHYEDYMKGKTDGKTALLNIEKEIKEAPAIVQEGGR